MLSRLCFLVIAVFWVVMNALLWRLEFRGQTELGHAVPVNVVLDKILTAPDDSALEILHRNEKIGYCRWQANVGEELATGKVGSEEFQPEGRIKRLTGYTVHLEGNFLLEEPGQRLRFQFDGDFSTEHAWKKLGVRVTARPRVWELQTAAAEKTLKLAHDDENGKWERTLTFEELADPGKLLRELGFPFTAIFLPQWSQSPRSVALGLTWEARNDWLKVGNSKARVYRLQAKILDRYQAVIIVSRVGEILRVELPNDIVLLNDALVNL
ncbi:MAG: hypothetical protein FJ403_11510 [Verrucomicrobia bacterium]|nr:hypothetical protein [Verrucomicrobiota bacterium]